MTETKKATLVQGNLLTERNVVKGAVREKFSKAIVADLMGDREHTIANDNSILIPLATDNATGKTIYARVQVSITAKDSFATGKSKAKAEVEEVEIPDLNL